MKTFEENLSYLSYSTNILYKILVGISSFLIISIFLNVYFLYSRKDIDFIALTPDMRVVNIKALDWPMISDNGIISWYMETISDTFSFTYNDYENRLSLMKYRYTNEAFDAIHNGFEPYIEIMAEKRQIINTFFTKSPRILKKGYSKNDNSYSWIVEGLATITTEGGTTQSMVQVIIRATIERVSPKVVPSGIIIKNLTFGDV